VHTHNGNGDLRGAFYLNFSFTIIEIIGGIWTNSIAILSDALHDFGDSLSLGLSWYLEKYSQKAKDAKYSYGYRRFSLLGALINTVVLIIGSGFVLAAAIPRLLNPESSDASGMMFLAIAGIIINGLAVLRVKNSKSLSVQVVTWHLLEDVLTWTAVLVVSIVLLFTNMHILDPILAVLVTFYVLYNVLRNLTKTSALFLQAVPVSIDVNDIEVKIGAIHKVQSTHHTHFWSLDGARHVLTTHLVVDESTTKDEVSQIKRELKSLTEDMGLEHLTIEIEYGNHDCSMKIDTRINRHFKKN